MWAPYDHTKDFPVEKGVFIGEDSEGNALYVGRYETVALFHQRVINVFALQCVSRI